MVEEVESLRGPCLEKHPLILPSQQFSAGSRVEAMARQETGPVSPVELAQWDEFDQA
jgi:hypothetical protein